MKKYVCIVAALFAWQSTQARDVANSLTQLNKKGVAGFIENRGQIVDQHGVWRSDLDFKLDRPGITAFVGSGKMHYQWSRLESPKSTAITSIAKQAKDVKLSTYRLDIELLGANLNATTITADKSTDFEQYYNANRQLSGKKIHHYSTVTYKDIYPNIDWVLYLDKNQATSGLQNLKYDFVVHPGGNPKDIKIQYKGAQELALTEDGSLRAVTPYGTHLDVNPYSYLICPDNSTQYVASRYVLKGNILSFDIAPHAGTLVIDPAVEWSTYYGGTGMDILNEIAGDTYGHIYIAGTTLMSSNIATTGSFQQFPSADLSDGFIAKFDKNGNRIWGTYYGGAGFDQGIDVDLAADGYLYFLGYTESTSGIASPNVTSTHVGGSDNFVVKFDTAGNRIWAKYIGSSGAEIGFKIRSNVFNHIYISGTTDGINYPVLNAHQSTKRGLNDGFLTRLDTAGNIVWSTYFGAEYSDNITGLASDRDGKVIISGLTAKGATGTTTFLSTLNSHQPAHAGGGNDIFIAVFDSAGVLNWCTYYGGSLEESTTHGNAVATDQLNNIFVVGSTQSGNNISTPNSYQSQGPTGGTYDAFIVKFDQFGNRIWGTYYGGLQRDDACVVSADNSGNIYVGGRTTSVSGISTPDAFQIDKHISYAPDAFFAKFNSAGQLLYGSYFGGEEEDAIVAIDFDNNGDVYFGGGTVSTTNIATPGAFNTTMIGYLAGFLTKFCISNIPNFLISGPDTVCNRTTTTFATTLNPDVSAYLWELPAALQGSSNTHEIDLTSATPGLYTIKLKVVKCDTSNYYVKEVYVRDNPIPIIATNGLSMNTQEVHQAYQWLSGGQPISGANDQYFAPNGFGDYQVAVVNEGGCLDTSAVFNFNGTGIRSAYNNDAVKIYPNPAQNLVNIESDEPLTISISSFDGRILLQDDKTNQLDLSTINPGVYLIQCIDRTGALVKVQRLVKL
jgi:hypothetical protein